ncbi:M23 family metallopeptidase [Marinilabilia salmonicolor]|uniref:M23 family metallopeptidase n=1 Tax=Marinilabilia salmonicolor TaxID=989 RepID=UPI00029A95B1|nr:M23 family metallopeptidase [Marinilabilia salmonicolor]
MPRHYIFSLQLVFLLLTGGVAGAQEITSGWDYHFPLEIKPKVSGSFGEIRSNHFHSGLDLATQGKTGLPVFAAETGYVSRIAVSAGGFGKALYIDHPSGYTTVYAHLESFSPVLDSLVLALQYQEESFEINKYLKPGDFMVERGEVIAYSGNSGSSGGPHLHFEVRITEGQKPIDPLAFSTPVKDDVRPHITGIKLYPLSAGATINGQKQPVYYPAVFYDGAFHLKHNPDIRATGTIGVGIDVLDYYTGSWRKCGVHSIGLKVNEEPVFSSVMDGFFFHDTRFVNSHIDYSDKMISGRTIQKSFVDPYNHINLYEFNAQRGKIVVEPGSDFQFDYLVKDISGNGSSLCFSVEGDRFLASGPVADQVGIFIDADAPYFYEESGHKVSMEKGTFYEDISGFVGVRESFISESGTVFSIFDKTIPVHNGFEIRFPLPDSTETNGLCGAVLDGNLMPQFAGGKADGSEFVINSRLCGDFLLVRDSVAPLLYLKNPPVQNKYSNREKMVVRMEDDFSGIAQFAGYINDQWVLFEYDAKNNQLTCFFDKVPFLVKGNHSLRIEVADNAGNVELLETNFRY